MILVDTSVWADHFRSTDPELGALIRHGQVAMHEHVLGELAIGNLQHWDQTVAALSALPRVPTASEAAWLACVRRHRLPGTGLGFVDVHLLAAIEAQHELRLWTMDKRLAAVAARWDRTTNLS